MDVLGPPEELRRSTDPRVAERMTKDCLILPSSKMDPEVLSQVAEVAVDPETGAVRLLQLTSSHDVGTVPDVLAFDEPRRILFVAAESGPLTALSSRQIRA